MWHQNDICPDIQAIALELLQSGLEMMQMFLDVFGEGQDVVHVAGTKRKISKDAVHQMLKGRP